MKKKHLKKIPRRFKLAAGLLVLFLAVSAIAVFCSVYLSRRVAQWDYLAVKRIIVRQDGKIANPTDFRQYLSRLLGKNIFRVDLKQEAAALSESLPAFRRINIVRMVPNTLFVDFQRRKAIAYVKLYKYFALDQDGVFFLALNLPEEKDIPLISGLETKIFGPQVGENYTHIQELSCALEIRSEFLKNNYLSAFPIIKIDASNCETAALFVAIAKDGEAKTWPSARSSTSALQVKVGKDSLRKKMRILEGLLKQKDLDLANIEYIDLSLKEPVFKLKNGK